MTTSLKKKSRSSKKNERFARLIAVLLGAGACADRAPPARFPETPPPGLAKPLTPAPERGAEPPTTEQATEPT
jgi:hypothetical protein